MALYVLFCVVCVLLVVVYVCAVCQKSMMLRVCVRGLLCDGVCFGLVPFFFWGGHAWVCFLYAWVCVFGV